MMTMFVAKLLPHLRLSPPLPHLSLTPSQVSSIPHIFVHWQFSMSWRGWRWGVVGPHGWHIDW